MLTLLFLTFSALSKAKGMIIIMVKIISYSSVIPCANNHIDLTKILKSQKDNKEQNHLILPYDLNQDYPGINLCANVGYNAGRNALIENMTHQEYDSKEIGVYCGTTYGGFYEGQKRQCDAFIKYGPRGVTPSLSIYNGIHLTSDIFAIKHQIKGANLTNTTGYIASGAALMQAFDDIEDKVLSDAIVIGSEQIDGLLLNILKQRGRTDTDLYKTGAGALWLSNRDIESDAETLFLKSVEIDSMSIKQWDETSCSQIIIKTIKKALVSSGLTAKNIDCIITCNNFSKEEEMGYGNALNQLFKEGVEKIEIVKILGHYMGANSIIASVCASLLISQNNSNLKNIVVVATDPSGMCFACVIGKEGNDYL